MSDKNTVSDEQVARMINVCRDMADNGEEGRYAWWDNIADALTELQSLRASIPGGVGVQCCMCGKTGLSTIEGDGGTECQLENGRWTCSEPCWEKAGGYGPDLSPAEGGNCEDCGEVGYSCYCYLNDDAPCAALSVKPQIGEMK